MNEPGRSFQPGREFAVALDRGDPLARFRDEFHIPVSENGEEEIYFAGNSLGLLPERTAKSRRRRSWRSGAARRQGPFLGENPWMPYHELLAEPMAKLVGASPAEVVTMNSLTVNLHLMMASFYRPTRERHRILIEEHAFPSDDYAVESQAIFHGFDPAEALVRLRPREGEHAIDTARVARSSRTRGRVDRHGPASGSPVLHGPGIRDRSDHAARPREGLRRRLRSGSRGGQPGPLASTNGTWISPCGARTST